ncbi:MAG TPA: tetratricopeptide repeat protein [Sandaracinaceae bacterium LLY-WYZ-13_1]|nr:tetratricopeptide repeat protein [Sandaracinaceae bacterium LLY-WYZ-13_1]
MKTRLSIIVASVLLSLTTPALAQDDERARALFEEGIARFERQNYALALESFQASYERMEGHPRQAWILFNIGRCYEELGRVEDARDAYRSFLRTAGPEAPDRADVEERLRELETRVELDAEDAEPADDRSTGAPADGGAAPSGGGGDDTLLIAGGISAGLAGVGLATFGLFGGLALGEYASVESGCGATRSCTDEQLTDLSTFTVVADVGLGVAVAGAAASLVLFVLAAGSSGDQASDDEVALAPWATDTGAGLALRGGLE